MRSRTAAPTRGKRGQKKFEMSFLSYTSKGGTFYFEEREYTLIIVSIQMVKKALKKLFGGKRSKRG